MNNKEMITVNSVWLRGEWRSNWLLPFLFFPSHSYILNLSSFLSLSLFSPPPPLLPFTSPLPVSPSHTPSICLSSPFLLYSPQLPPTLPFLPPRPSPHPTPSSTLYFPPLPSSSYSPVCHSFPSLLSSPHRVKVNICVYLNAAVDRTSLPSWFG